MVDIADISTCQSYKKLSAFKFYYVYIRSRILDVPALLCRHPMPTQNASLPYLWYVGIKKVNVCDCSYTGTANCITVYFKKVNVL